MGTLRKGLIVILSVVVMTTSLLALIPSSSNADDTVYADDNLNTVPQAGLSTSPSQDPIPDVPIVVPPDGPAENSTVSSDPEPSEPTLPKDHRVTVGSMIDGVTAQDAFCYDCGSDEFTYVKGHAHTKLYPASITKLFTAYVALRYLNPEEKVTVGKIINTLPSDSSVALLSVGDRMTVHDLIYAMILPSGGDAARVLAVAAGRAYSGNQDLPEKEAMQVFMNEMNHQAQENGMYDTHFVNPDGYHDDDHYTSLADVVTIGKLSLQNSLVMQAARTRVYSGKRLNCHKELQWINTNHLIQEKRYPRHYSPDAVGLKTGHTSTAGNCLLAAFKKDGRYILVGVFGCVERNGRYTSALNIYNSLGK